MSRVAIERVPLPPLRSEPPTAAPELPAPPARVRKRPAARTGHSARDPYLDNAKYLTIVLVAVGHAWAPLTADSRTAGALYYLLYSFHMPVFVIISGFLSRGFEGGHRQASRLIAGVVVPYTLFQTLHFVLARWSGGAPDRELHYQEPGFALWFLPALCLWRLTTPLWKMLRRPLAVSVVVAVAASVTPTIDDDLDLMRVAQFLPFFVLGLRLRPAHFELVRHRAVRMLAVPVAACALVVSYWAVPRISGAPFLHDRAAQDLGLSAWAGASMTTVSFGCALVTSVCFLAWVPRRRTWFTTLGAGTLYAYLLHIFPAQLARQYGLYETEWAGRPLGHVGITVLAAVGMTLLCTGPVRRGFRFLLEPRMEWFFRRETDAPADAAADAAADAPAAVTSAGPSAGSPAPTARPTAAR